MRESNRHFFTATIEPLGSLISQELSEKLETPVVLVFPEHTRSDISARARAFQGLIAAGVRPVVAAGIVGIPTAGLDNPPPTP